MGHILAEKNVYIKGATSIGTLYPELGTKLTVEGKVQIDGLCEANTLVVHGKGTFEEVVILSEDLPEKDNHAVTKKYIDRVISELASGVADSYTVLPIGAIILYNGLEWQDNETIPGWYACIGENSTVNLQDQFVKISTEYVEKNIGGDDNIQLSDYRAIYIQKVI